MSEGKVGEPNRAVIEVADAMSTTLAQQLAQVAKLQKQSNTLKKVRGRPSLLFDQQKAADVDIATLFTIGCQGEHSHRFIRHQQVPKHFMTAPRRAGRALPPGYVFLHLP
jgi:hypothetical protein